MRPTRGFPSVASFFPYRFSPTELVCEPPRPVLDQGIGRIFFAHFAARHATRDPLAATSSDTRTGACMATWQTPSGTGTAGACGSGTPSTQG